LLSSGAGVRKAVEGWTRTSMRNLHVMCADVLKGKAAASVQPDH
jgi:hypothetical protein